MLRTTGHERTTHEIRCPDCGALLAKHEGNAIAIRRNDLQVSFHGEGLLSVLCWRRSCRKLTVVCTKQPSGRSGPAG